jgi:hypothetical protein
MSAQIGREHEKPEIVVLVHREIHFISRCEMSFRTVIKFPITLFEFKLLLMLIFYTLDNS